MSSSPSRDLDALDRVRDRKIIDASSRRNAAAPEAIRDPTGRTRGPKFAQADRVAWLGS